MYTIAFKTSCATSCITSWSNMKLQYTGESTITPQALQCQGPQLPVELETNLARETVSAQVVNPADHWQVHSCGCSCCVQMCQCYNLEDVERLLDYYDTVVLMTLLVGLLLGYCWHKELHHPHCTATTVSAVLYRYYSKAATASAVLYCYASQPTSGSSFNRMPASDADLMAAPAVMLTCLKSLCIYYG